MRNDVVKRKSRFIKNLFGGGLLLLLLASSITPIFANWTVYNNDSVVGNFTNSSKIGVGDSTNTSDVKNCVIANYNDGTGKTEEVTVSNGQINAPTTPTDNSYHEFIGWFTTRNGINSLGNSTQITFPYTPTKNYQEIYARYKTLNGLDEEIETMNLNSSNSDTSNYYYLGTENGDSTMYINSLNTLQVKYNTGTGTSDGIFNPNLTSTSADSDVIEPLTSAQLIIKLDCDLVINGGTLQLNSCFDRYRSTGGINYFICQIVGNFTCLDLNGYTITITNGGAFNAYGIVYNSQDTGGIINESGSIYTAFSVIDYKGGKKLCLGFSRAITPFFLYCVPYLTCEVVCTTSGSIKAFTSLFASSVSATLSEVPTVFRTNFTIIGNSSDAIFTLNKGYCIKRATSYDDLIAVNGTSGVQANLYDTDFRETLIFTDSVENHLTSLDAKLGKASYCDVELRPLALNLNINALGTTYNVSPSFKYFDFPIPSYYNIELYNVHIDISFPLVIMPGANVYVDEDTVINMTNTTGYGTDYRIFGRISVIDEYPSNLYKFMYSSTSYNTTSKASVFMNILTDIVNNSEPPKVIMKGIFTFDSSNCNYSNLMGHYYTIGGHIDCSKQAIDSLTNKVYYLELITRFYYPVFFGDTGICSYEFYNTPLISNGVAYFQPNGRGTQVYAATSFNEVDNVYVYNNSYYYYQYLHDYTSSTAYTEATYTSGYYEGDIVQLISLAEAAANGPLPDRYKEKMQDLNGRFTRASSYSTITNGTNKTSYVYDGTNYRVNVAGVWTKISAIPTNSFSSLTLVSNTSNKLYVDMDNFSISSTLSFNTSKQRWALDA